MSFMDTITAPFARFVEGRRRKIASLPKIVRRSIYISIAFHVALFLAAGVVVIGRLFYNRDSTFQGQPPPMRAYEPRKLEFKVKLSKQARSSSRPAMAPRMVSTKLNANISLPEIKVDPKVVKTSFQPKFKAITGTGLGAGIGNGYGLGGFGEGISAFDFFGIRGRGNKIAILVDVSVSMVEEERGGPKGFVLVRERINKVIDALNEGAVFNVIVFADAASAFEKTMQVATDNNKTKAKQFLKGFNTLGNYGLTSGNLQPSSVGLPAVGGTTRLDIALTAAFDQGADTILIISDGIPKVRKGITAQQIADHRAMTQKWQGDHAAELQQYDAMAASYVAPPTQVQSTRVWIPEQPGQPARPPRPPSNRPPKEGQAPDMGDPGAPATPPIPGHWEVRTTTSGGGGPPPRPAPPPMPDPGWWTLSDFFQHLKLVHEAQYLKKGMKMPVIHTILYGDDKEGGAFLQTLASTYKGRYRKVTKL